jgi:dTDP-4-amino-4,6-dideoxygalactose transaminase
MRIPFNKPYITRNELEYIKRVIESIDSGATISGDGEYTKKVQTFIESRFHTEKALLTTSCTSALEMATTLINLQPGDEVIVPSYTFASTVNPIVMAGAKPVFVDVDKKTLNIDTNEIKQNITPKTKAIYPVHYAGVACDMDDIMDIADQNQLAVVEDAAQGVNAKFRQQYLGTIGDFGCYSFHETKNYVCGEGGALLINTDDRRIRERAEIIREKGTNRSKFYRGEINKYTWVDIGSSYLPSDILAAFLYAQFEALDEIQSKRMKIYNAYCKLLRPYEQDGHIQLPTIPHYAKHNAHLFYVIFPNEKSRGLMISKLKKDDISTVFHYVPLHTSEMGRIWGNNAQLPITDMISECLLRLPLFAGMKRNEYAYLSKRLTFHLDRLFTSPQHLQT